MFMFNLEVQLHTVNNFHCSYFCLFFQSLSAAVAFFYSSHLILQWQLLILVIMNLLGFAAFAIVELRTSKPPERRYARINNSEDVDSS